MTILGRISKLFKADVHCILDQLEEPAAVLKQALREMEEEIRKDMQLLAQMKTRAERLNSRKNAHDREVSGTDEQLEVCFIARNESLAKAMIRKRLEAQKRIAFISNEIEKENKEIEVLSHRIKEREEAMNHIREKFELLTEEAFSTEPADKDPCKLRVTEEEVEVAFLRAMQERNAGEQQGNAHK